MITLTSDSHKGVITAYTKDDVDVKLYFDKEDYAIFCFPRRFFSEDFPVRLGQELTCIVVTDDKKGTYPEFKPVFNDYSQTERVVKLRELASKIDVTAFSCKDEK